MDPMEDLEDMEISDEELIRMCGLKRPTAVSGVEAAIVVDNIPKGVEGDRLKKLAVVIKRIMSRFGTIVGEPVLPLDERGVTAGYAFLEYKTEAQAKEAVDTANGYKLDNNHIFSVNFLTDLERYANLSESFAPPQSQEYVEEENLRQWLQNSDAQDQYLVHHGAGKYCSIYYNATNEPKLVHEKEYWTDKYMRFTPKGTYAASLHKQGVILWGGADFPKKKRFAHRDVQVLDFSPCERYLVTFNNAPHSDSHPDALIVWDIRLGEKKRAFNSGPQKEWPIFKWNHDGSMFARMGDGVISIYESSTCRLHNGESLVVKGICQFSWSPSDNVIAYWTPEELSIPARVNLVELPSRQEIRSINLFSVADCKIVWHGQGDYLAVKVDRFTNNRKKATVANFEIFRMREKNIPVEKIELKDPVQGFAWEPHGNKFAIMHEHAAFPGVSISFYEMGSDSLKLVKTLEKKLVSHVCWSPQGQFVVLAGLKQSNGILEFYDTSDMTLANVTEHLMATDVEWDPTGRFVVSSVSYWMQKVDTGYNIWSLSGKLLQRHSIDGFCQLLWRPRPKTLLSEEQLEGVRRDRKKYASMFEIQDRRARSNVSEAWLERRQRMMADWKEFRGRVEGEMEDSADRRRELRGEDEDVGEEEYDVEVVEYLVKVEENIVG